MRILSTETDNCPSWISVRERMTIENISWSISTKECCILSYSLGQSSTKLALYIYLSVVLGLSAYACILYSYINVLLRNSVIIPHMVLPLTLGLVWKSKGQISVLIFVCYSVFTSKYRWISSMVYTFCMWKSHLPQGLKVKSRYTTTSL